MWERRFHKIFGKNNKFMFLKKCSSKEGKAAIKISKNVGMFQ